METPDVRVDRVRWEWREQSGWVWRARMARTAQMTVLPSNEVRWLHELVPASAPQTLMVINGGFYEDGPMGLVVAGGSETAPLTDRGGSGVLVYDGQHVSLVHRDDWHGQGSEALQSIDRLIVNGESVVARNEEGRFAARSAVVLTSEWVWLVIQAADASTESSNPLDVRIPHPYDHGMPLWAFAEWLVAEMQPDFALNMDGGLSTNLVVRAADESFTLTGVDGTINAVMFSPQGPVEE